MTSLITGTINHITPSLGSHSGARAHVYADSVKQSGKSIKLNYKSEKIDDYNKFNSIYVYHADYDGKSLNLFGGLKNIDAAESLYILSKYKGDVYSLGLDFPNYSDAILNRLKGKIDYPEIWDKIDIEGLRAIESRAKTLFYPNKTDKMVIGDSHSISMYRPGWMVNSVPFQTLHGALKLGLESFIEPNLSNLEIYFGNIDIRHHINRRNNPEEAIKILTDELSRQCIDLNKNIKSVKVYEPLPIENESRKLPKSGYYKGEPFSGSWEKRNEYRDIFVNNLVENNIDVIRWSDYLKNSSGELDFKFMENKQSVHLARHSFPYWQIIEKKNTLF